MVKRMKLSEQHFNTVEGGSRSAGLKKSLGRIKSACDALDQLKAEISVTSVKNQIQLIYGKGAGPTAGTIRNDKERLLAYVKLRRSEQTLPMRGLSEKPEYKIPPITDEKVRAYVTLITHQNRQLLNENNRLKSAFKRLSPIDIRAPIQRTTGKEGEFLVLPVSAAHDLPDRNVDIGVLSDLAKKILNPPSDFYMEVAEIEGEEILRMKTNKKVLLMPKYMKVLRALERIRLDQEDGQDPSK
jgi:hypothetical protein